jgi:hypothetical protein
MGVGLPHRISLSRVACPCRRTAKRVRRPEPYVCGKDTPPQPGDEQCGAFSRDRLVAMDQRFVRAIERAFENGTEHRQSAAMNGANASRARYR